MGLRSGDEDGRWDYGEIAKAIETEKRLKAENAALLAERDALAAENDRLNESLPFDVAFVKQQADEYERLYQMADSQAARFMAERDALVRERDAYKRAKEENDERFMNERDEARQERDALRAENERIKEKLEVVEFELTCAKVNS